MGLNSRYNCLFARAVSLLLIALLATPSWGEQVRVGLMRSSGHASGFTISSTSDFTASDQQGNTLLTVSAEEPLLLKVGEGRTLSLYVVGSDIRLAVKVRLEASDKEGRFSVSSPTGATSEYRGVLEVCNEAGGGLLLINELDVEDYLLGVVPSEMPSVFHKEALKAQAIAARTYTLANVGKHDRLGYGLCDGVCCQRYQGASGEQDTVSLAVRETQGMIITYEGKPIHALYSANCGGYSESVINAGGHEFPYLRSRPDRAASDQPDFCANSAGYRWTKTYTSAQIQELLNRAGYKVSDIESIAIAGVNASGRVTGIRIKCLEGEIRLSGVQFRHALGNSAIKSALFSLSATSDGDFVFEGKGFGHGVGLCQHGANMMAASPREYGFRDILAHYYPGTTLQPIKPEVSQPPAIGPVVCEQPEPVYTPVDSAESAESTKKKPRQGTWPWNF